MNTVLLVGRLTTDPDVREYENNNFRTTITLAVQRDYKNTNGIYETDFIKCVLWNGIATAVKEYCHKGDIVGVKGKIQVYSYELENEDKKKIIEIVADKVNFISTPKK